MPMHVNINSNISQIYKAESGRVLATLIRILGDFHRAEEAMQDAFSVALEKWPKEGIPKNPYSWLVSAGKFKAIDAIRREKRGRELIAESGLLAAESSAESEDHDFDFLEDDQLRLIFLCCHPALPLDSRIALALRDVCGMRTEEIARAYLLPFETIKKRISRAKALFRDKHIPFEIPPKSEMTGRLNAVLHIIYLIFNEGYAASAGDNHLRKELTDEALFLCRKLVALTPAPEGMGLLALLLIQEARRESRVNEDGELIALEAQDRTIWNRALINEGIQFIQQAIMSGRLGPYTLQAAIASVHAVADSLENTQWDLIVGYYDMLLTIQPSVIISLNRAIAVGMKDGPEAGIVLIDALAEDARLISHHLTYAARADFLKRLGSLDGAIKDYKKAIELCQSGPERRYLEKQLAEILK